MNNNIGSNSIEENDSLSDQRSLFSNSSEIPSSEDSCSSVEVKDNFDSESDCITSLDIYKADNKYYMIIGSIQDFFQLYAYENVDTCEVIDTVHTEDSVADVKFNYAGTYVAAACLNGKLHVLYGPNHSKPLFEKHNILEMNTDDLEWITWHQNDDNILIAGSVHLTVYLWDVAEGICPRMFHGFGDTVCYGTFINQGDAACAGSCEGTLKVFDYNNCNCLFTDNKYDDSIIVITGHKELPLLAVGYSSGTVKLYHSTNFTLLNTFTIQKNCIECLEFAPQTADNKTYLASGSMDGTIHIWDCSTYREKACLKENDPEEVSGIIKLKWLYDEKLYLLAGSTSSKINLWELFSKKLVKSFQFSSSLMCMAEIDDILVAGLQDGSLIIKNMKEE